MFLVKNGVGYDRALAMGEAELLAHLVTFGEIEGGEWDWNTLRWRERK